MSDQPEKREFVHVTMLGTVYGLTRKMVEDLGEPDKLGPDEGRLPGQLARLYSVDRVEAWVAANQEWLDRAHAVRAQRAAVEKAAAEALRLAKEAERLERLRRVETAPIAAEAAKASETAASAAA
jgi:hypothetical protein